MSVNTLDEIFTNLGFEKANLGLTRDDVSDSTGFCWVTLIFMYVNVLVNIVACHTDDQGRSGNYENTPNNIAYVRRVDGVGCWHYGVEEK